MDQKTLTQSILARPSIVEMSMRAYAGNYYDRAAHLDKIERMMRKDFGESVRMFYDRPPSELFSSLLSSAKRCLSYEEYQESKELSQSLQRSVSPRRTDPDSAKVEELAQEYFQSIPADQRMFTWADGDRIQKKVPSKYFNRVYNRVSELINQREADRVEAVKREARKQIREMFAEANRGERSHASVESWARNQGDRIYYQIWRELRDRGDSFDLNDQEVDDRARQLAALLGS